MIHFYSQWRGLHGVRPGVILSARPAGFEIWLRPFSFRAHLIGVQVSSGRGYLYVGDTQLKRIHYYIGGPK